MAKTNSARSRAPRPARSIDEIKRRVAALGDFELIITDAGEQLVLEKAPNDGPIEVVFRHRNDGDDNLVDDWLEHRELVARHGHDAATVTEEPAKADGSLRDAAERVLKVSRAQAVSTALEEALRALETALNVGGAPEQSTADDPIDCARSDAQMLGYDARFLVEAASKLNSDGADDGPLDQVLEAADAKLGALINALDSLNWPKGGAA